MNSLILALNIYAALVVRVIDADTLVVRLDLMPGLSQEVAVRVEGIDTPEMTRPSKECPDHERALAEKATGLAERLVANARMVYITRVKKGKFAGRVIAKVLLEDVQGNQADYGEMLLAAGLAHPYDGSKKKSWCEGQPG